MVIRQFLWGMLAMAHLMAALLLTRFWRVGRDRLFLFFACGFAIMALHWVGLALIDPGREPLHLLYLVRLLAFVLFIIGIADKNRRARRSGR